MEAHAGRNPKIAPWLLLGRCPGEFEQQLQTQQDKDQGKAPDLRDVHIYYDNRNGPESSLTIGQIAFTPPAGASGDFWFPSAGCPGTADVALNGAHLDVMKFSDPNARLYFLGMQPDRCYKDQVVSYSRGGIEPSIPPSSMVGHHLYSFGGDKVDYFLAPPPSVVMTNADFSAFAIYNDRCPVSVPPN